MHKGKTPFTHDEVKSAFAEVLKIARKTVKGMSQEDLAVNAEVDRTYPSLLERRQRCPTLWVLINLSEALDLDPDLFVKLVMARLRRTKSIEEIKCLLR